MWKNKKQRKSLQVKKGKIRIRKENKMQILLDAYFDNNFGDDLFIDLLLKRYSKERFYTFWKSTKQSVFERANNIFNLNLLPKGCIMQESLFFDAYIMIGGDVLPDGIDYTERISCMKRIKEQGGFVAMLGFSLYQSYGEQTRQDLKTMAFLADAIVIRDKYSAERFQKIVPEAKVIESTDMAFTIDYKMTEIKKSNPAILGIAARRKLYSTEEEYCNYCQSMAQIADAYLQKYPEGKVHFLAFSTGEYDDRITASDIIKKMKEKEKIEVIAYQDSIDSFVEAIKECRALIPTRFHALVFALLYQIPFIPVPYEAKCTQLLDEIGYFNIRVNYGEALEKNQEKDIIDNICQFHVDREKLNIYKEKSKSFFLAIDNWKKKQEKEIQKSLKNIPIMVCKYKEEVESLRAEKDMLIRQEEELTKWIDALKQERQKFEKQYQELENLRKSQKEEMEAAWKHQEEELMKWIESLKKERKQFERQNMELEEIRKWEWEQLLKYVRRPKKLMSEYELFLQKLKGNLDKHFDV